MKNWWVPGLQIGYAETFVHQAADFIQGLSRRQDAGPDLQGWSRDGLRDGCGAQIREDQTLGEGEKSEGRLNSELVRAKERQDEEFMNMKSIAVGLVIAGGALALNAEDIKVDVSKLPPAAAKTGVTFDKDIKPIFEKSCFKCHGPEVEKPKGKFRADTKENVIKGAVTLRR